MNKVNLNIISWNVGKDGDYYGVCQRKGKVITHTEKEFSELRDQLFKNIFKNIHQKHFSDFICLQETGNDFNRIQSWIGEDYHVISDGYDAAICWNKKRFTLDSNSVRYSKLSKSRFCIIADFFDHIANKVISVASAHIKGFDLADFEEETASYGDKEVKEVLDILNESSASLKILGMDANSTMNIHPERIKLCIKQKFKPIDTDKKVSAYNPTLKGNAAKIDFILASPDKNHLIQKKKFECFIPIENPEINPSDHRPVTAQITFKKKLSFFDRAS